MNAGSLLRTSRRAAGLSQRALAQLAGVSQPALADIERGAHDTNIATLTSILGTVHFQILAVPTTGQSVASWADVIHQQLRSKSVAAEQESFRSLIGLSDDLAQASECARVALCVAPPATTGDRRFDAAIAGIVEYHLGAKLPQPEWLDEPSRFLTTLWEATPFVSDNEIDEPFRRRGVLLARSELRSD